MTDLCASAYWTPEPIFRGETVFVIGGGPSLRGFDFEQMRGRRCIAVNSSGFDTPWADLLVFHDNSWFENEANKRLALEWPGVVVTLSRHAKIAAPDKIRRVEAVHRAAFPIATAPIRVGHSSGQTAVSLAITLAAARVVLLGFDMRSDAGRTHYHQNRPLYTEAHAAMTAPLYASSFLPAWLNWNADALAVGCEVRNATPGSALTEFPSIDLEDVL